MGLLSGWWLTRINTISAQNAPRVVWELERLVLVTHFGGRRSTSNSWELRERGRASSHRIRLVARGAAGCPVTSRNTRKE